MPHGGGGSFHAGLGFRLLPRIQQVRIVGFNHADHGLAGHDRVTGLERDPLEPAGQRAADRVPFLDPCLAVLIDRDGQRAAGDRGEIDLYRLGTKCIHERPRRRDGEHQEQEFVGCKFHSRVLSTATRSR